jgi:Spy/CpxP family protein refolding chaperone
MRRWLILGFVLSLTLNLMLLGGYAYKRMVTIPHARAAWGAEALHLGDTQRADLQHLTRWAREELGRAVPVLRSDAAILEKIVAEGRADDAQIEAALRRIGEHRVAMQRDAMQRVIAFRDTLNAEQRKIFARLASEPAFVARLLGLRPATAAGER